MELISPEMKVLADKRNDHPLITVSVVSHLQGNLLLHLLDDFQQYCADLIEVIITINIWESFDLDVSKYNYPIQIIRNENQKGFASNHNSAFERHNGHFFCVINPDVRLVGNPFPVLIRCFDDPSLGSVAPQVFNPSGSQENSARRFPTVFKLIRKAIGLDKPDYSIASENLFVDWIAGLFMFFRGDVFIKIKGFDERYFLYYEDVDICWRLWKAGYKVMLSPAISIIHDAKLQSHSNLKYLKWHISSLIIYLTSTGLLRRR